MKKLLAILYFLMLISQLVICQSVYPRKAVIDKDTVGILSIDQVKHLNKKFIELDQCKEINDNLNLQIETYDKLKEKMETTIHTQEKEITVKQNIITEQQKILQTDDEIAKKMKRKIRWLKFQRGGLSIVIIALLVASAL